MAGTDAMAMPSITGQAVELFSRVPQSATNTNRPATRGSIPDNTARQATLSARPSTSHSVRSEDRRALLQVSRGGTKCQKEIIVEAGAKKESGGDGDPGDGGGGKEVRINSSLSVQSKRHMLLRVFRWAEVNLFCRARDQQ